MKKFLISLIGLFLLIVLFRKFGFFNLNSSSKSKIVEQATNTSQIIISQSVNEPIIGIHYRMVDQQSSDENNIVDGVYITQIIKGLPAEKAGLQEEDIIIEIDGRITAGLDSQSIYNLVSTLKPGAQINLKIWRNGEIKSILVILE